MNVPLSVIEFAPFTMQGVWLLVALICLLVVSALVSGSETAFFSLTPSDVKWFRESSSSTSSSSSSLSGQCHAVLELLEKQDYLLAAILIVNNMVNIGAIIVANSLMDSFVLVDGVVWEYVVKVVVVTFLLLFFGEIMPKILAAYFSRGYARRVALVARFMVRVCRPLSYLLISAGGGVTKMLSRRAAGAGDVSIDELSDAIDMTATDSAEDKKMLSGIVSFVGTEVAQIMRARVDVVALDSEDDFAEVRRVVVSSGHSRIPVYDDSFDHVRGVLYIKDLLPFLDRGDDFDWLELVRKPFFVPDNKKINDLLEDFQSRKVHLAIVVDEYGGTLGIVTLEDILEEIVGEIADESDIESNFYTKLDDHTYLFEGKTHISDFLRVLKIQDRQLEQVKSVADTLAGVMLEIKGDFFKQGELITLGSGVVLSAEVVEHYRIMMVRVVLP